MESYGQTKSRIAGDEAPMEPKKKKRRGGNDSIEFLREKSQLELEARKSELEIKERETARSFEQQERWCNWFSSNNKTWWRYCRNW